MDLFRELKSVRDCIAPNTYRTIKGQILSGNTEGARVGLARIKEKAERERLRMEGGTAHGKGAGN